MNALLSSLLAVSCLAQPAGPLLPPVTALAFAPDGKALVVGSQQGVEIRSWPELRLIRRIETGLSQVHDLAFAPDGRRLAVAGGIPAEEGAVEVYRWPDAERLYRAEGHSDVVYAVAWTGDSACWVAASLDGTVTVRGAADGQPLDWLAGHSGGVKAVAFLPDGSTLVSGGLDQTLRVWNIGAPNDRARKNRAPEDSEPKLRAPTDDAPMNRAPTSAGRKLSARNDGPAVVRAPMVRARNTSDSELRAPGETAAAEGARMVRALTNHTAPVHDLAVRPAAGADRPALPLVASVGDDRTVRLWQPTIGRMVRFVRLKDAVPLAVRWTLDGRRLLVACSDGRVRVIDSDTVEVLHELDAVEGWTYSLAVDPGGKDAAVGGERGQVARVALPE